MSEVKRPAHRPTKYNEAMQATAERYLSEWQEFGDATPQLAGLACFCGITRDTMNRWRKIHKDFSDVAMAVEVMQERTIVNGALTKDFDSAMARTILGTHHGYSDRSTVDHKSTDGSMSPRDTGKAVLEAIRAKHAPDT